CRGGLRMPWVPLSTGERENSPRTSPEPKPGRRSPFPFLTASALPRIYRVGLFYCLHGTLAPSGGAYVANSAWDSQRGWLAGSSVWYVLRVSGAQGFGPTDYTIRTEGGERPETHCERFGRVAVGMSQSPINIVGLVITSPHSRFVTPHTLGSLGSPSRLARVPLARASPLSPSQAVPVPPCPVCQPPIHQHNAGSRACWEGPLVRQPRKAFARLEAGVCRMCTLTLVEARRLRGFVLRWFTPQVVTLSSTCLRVSFE